MMEMPRFRYTRKPLVYSQVSQFTYWSSSPSVELSSTELIETIYDGIQRPLSVLKRTGSTRWTATKNGIAAAAKVGVSAGEVLGTAEETIAVTQSDYGSAGR